MTQSYPAGGLGGLFRFTTKSRVGLPFEELREAVAGEGVLIHHENGP